MPDPEGGAPGSILFRYSDEAGLRGILSTGVILASTTARNPRDVRHGEGQYLSDRVPGTMTPARLSRRLVGQPFQGRRFTHFVAIRVDGPDVAEARPGVGLLAGRGPLDVSGRVVGHGRVATGLLPRGS